MKRFLAVVAIFVVVYFILTGTRLIEIFMNK